MHTERFDPPVGPRSDHCGETDSDRRWRRFADVVSVLALGLVLAVVGGALSALWILYVVDSLR